MKQKHPRPGNDVTAKPIGDPKRLLPPSLRFVTLYGLKHHGRLPVGELYADLTILDYTTGGWELLWDRTQYCRPSHDFTAWALVPFGIYRTDKLELVEALLKPAEGPDPFNRKPMLTARAVEELRNQGYPVEVRHYRFLRITQKITVTERHSPSLGSSVQTDVEKVAVDESISP